MCLMSESEVLLCLQADILDLFTINFLNYLKFCVYTPNT